MKTLRCQLSLCLFVGVTLSPSVGAAVIRQPVGVQTGTVNMNNAAQPVALPTPVLNTSRAFVICYYLPPGNSNATERATCELNSTTTLTVTAGVADPNNIVRWYVVEFLSGVSVQRGSTTIAAGSLTAAVPIAHPFTATPFDLTNTFALISERTTQTSQVVDEQFTLLAQLTTGSNLQLTRTQNNNPNAGNVSSAVTVVWQVIQIDSASVQTGTATILQNQTVNTVAVTLAAPIDMTRTFLVFTRNGGANNATSINGDETFYQTTGEITNSTTLTFRRGRQNNTNNTQINIAWFVVRMTDGTTVLRNVCGPSLTSGVAAAATMPANPATCLTRDSFTGNLINIDTTRSVPIVSIRDGTNSAQTADLDDSSWQAALTATTITLTRSTNASNVAPATAAWQIVQFNKNPNLIEGDGREIFP